MPFAMMPFANCKYQSILILHHMVHFFALALTISEILTFTIFYIENLGQSHEGEKTCTISWQMFESMLVIFSEF